MKVGIIAIFAITDLSLIGIPINTSLRDQGRALVLTCVAINIWTTAIQCKNYFKVIEVF